jgi:hypothetical protein
VHDAEGQGDSANAETARHPVRDTLKGCAEVAGCALEVAEAGACCLEVAAGIGGLLGLLVLAVCWKLAPIAAACALLASDQVV